MKKAVFLTLAAALIAGGVFAQNNDSNSERKEIVGNGKITTRDVSVRDFEALEAQGVYELKLSQGGSESVRVEADENLQEFVVVRQEGKKLVIDMPKLKNHSGFRTKNPLRVYVTFRQLKEMDLKMVGNVNAEKSLSFDDLQLKNKSVGHLNLNLTANKLNLENKSVGNVTLAGKANEAVVRNHGVGAFRAGDFVVQTMNIENHGMGSADVNAEKDLKVKNSGMGKVKNKGKASKRSMNAVRV